MSEREYDGGLLGKGEANWGITLGGGGLGGKGWEE